MANLNSMDGCTGLTAGTDGDNLDPATLGPVELLGTRIADRVAERIVQAAPEP